jgi:hypothetical protein
VTETDILVFKASSFEVDPSQSTSQAGHAVSGFIGVDDEDEKILEELKSLCEKENVDKVIIVYRNYEFELVGVSLSTHNDNPPRIHVKRNKQYRFQARDIGLAALHKSAAITESKDQSVIDQ